MPKKSEPVTKPEMTEAFKAAYESTKGENNNQLDISQEGVTATKYAVAGITDNTASLNGTTNLRPKQIKALSKLKFLNSIYGCEAISEYHDDILEKNRSITDSPISFLNLLQSIMQNDTKLQNPGILQRMGLRR